MDRVPGKSGLRARELGLIVGELEPGVQNSITDIPGVCVGQCTMVRGHGPLVPGTGPVRTGVTAILPHPRNVFREKLRAAIHVINGFGKATGIAQVMELGVLETPIVLTNTLSVGITWDAVCRYMLEGDPDIGVTTGTVNPVIAECNDGYLNDIRGGHVKKEHVLESLQCAHNGPVQEGNVGAGTGMCCLGFKGGIGTASRRLRGRAEHCHLGALVLSNFGSLSDLTVLGVPVGKILAGESSGPKPPPGSIVVVIATDAPFQERQLLRIAKRCQAGLARVGSFFHNGSGDFVITFSTENRVSHEADCLEPATFLRDDGEEMASAFRAAVETTEEAVYNSLICAETMVGRDGHIRHGLPIERLMEILRKTGAV